MIEEMFIRFINEVKDKVEEWSQSGSGRVAEGILEAFVKGAVSRGFCCFRSILYLNHYFEALINHKQNASVKLRRRYRVSSGFQTLENNKSTRPAASCFHQFSHV